MQIRSTLHVLWFRRDLRLDDHPALLHACRLGPVLPLFILDPALLHHPETGAARVQLMLRQLQALDRDLRQRGSALVLRHGEPLQELLTVIRRSGARGVVAHRDSERLLGRVRDARVSRALAAEGIALHLLEAPGATGELMAYSDYRRFWHVAMAAAPLAAPSRIPTPALAIPAAPLQLPDLAALGLAADDKPQPPAGTAAALALLARFCSSGSSGRYHWQLSLPSAKVTTGLGPYLKFGVISHRRAIHAISDLQQGSSGQQRSWRQLVSRLRWGAGMAQRFRYLPQLELRPLWDCFEAEAAALTAQQQELYCAWQQGSTGFPIVDAAARCLLAEGGWRELNFRSRAIHASFLVNLCGIDWRYGALHYMRHLLDGDCCIDHYQWAMQAGVTAAGSDQAWSRIYHPGQVAVDRCDPQGLFIRRWLPELADLTNDQLGSPPPMAEYPRPLLDYHQARQLRLETLERQRRRWRPDGYSALPADLSPFGGGLSPAPTWCAQPSPALEPIALPLAELEPPQRQQLRSWFRSGVSPSAAASRGRSRRSRRGATSAGDGAIQLSLWPGQRGG